MRDLGRAHAYGMYIFSRKIAARISVKYLSASPRLASVYGVPRNSGLAFYRDFSLLTLQLLVHGISQLNIEFKLKIF